MKKLISLSVILGSFITVSTHASVVQSTEGLQHFEFQQQILENNICVNINGQTRCTSLPSGSAFRD